MESEIWKDIPGYEGLYQVSNLGDVKSLDRSVEYVKRNHSKTIKGVILKKNMDAYGYYHVGLSKSGKSKTVKIHKLVAVAFLNHVPCGYKLVVNHKDHNPLNNMVDNLEIVTNRENTNRKHIKSSSKYTGVVWNKRSNSWQSQIWIFDKSKHLGYYKNEHEAHLAYEKALIHKNTLKGILTVFYLRI